VDVPHDDVDDNQDDDDDDDYYVEKDVIRSFNLVFIIVIFE